MLKANLHIASLIVSLSGFLFGYDTGAIGPITEMIHFFALSPGPRGLIVASLLFSALPASIAAGYLADKYGRLPVMISGSLSSFVGMIICSSSFSLGQYIAGRVMAGIGQGLFFTISGVWQVESAPTAIRGRIGAMSQLFFPIGLASGYFVSYGTVSIQSSMSWRVVNIVQGLVAGTALLCLCTPLVPESPRWLLLTQSPSKALKAQEIIKAYAKTPEKGREAWTELSQDVLREQANGASEVRLEHVQGRAAPVPVATQAEVIVGRGVGRSGADMCANSSGRGRFAMHRELWGRALTSVILNLMVALSGIDAVLWYAPLLYAQAGLQLQRSTFIAGGIMALIMVVVTIPAQAYLIDHIPRRLSIALGALGMAATLFIIGALRSATFSLTNALVAQWITIVMINVYVVFCQTLFVAPLFVLATEILPNQIRSTVSSTARAGLSLGNIVLALSTPKWVAANALSFWITMGCFNLFTVSLAIFVLPETLNVPMEQIDAVWRKGHQKRQARWNRFITFLRIKTKRVDDSAVSDTSSRPTSAEVPLRGRNDGLQVTVTDPTDNGVASLPTGVHMLPEKSDGTQA